MLLQINPTIPVVVTSKGNSKAMALFIIDYSTENDIIWGVGLDDSGEIWWVPNKEVRLQNNWTMGRRFT